MVTKATRLVLLRHGQSQWNLENRFNVKVFTTQMMFQKNELNVDDFDEIIKNVEDIKGIFSNVIRHRYCKTL